ncbi:MAG: hypothetical protein IJT70_07205 [Clostridia bacterium]|nr:hypothetical protein [Clostridia bacterium]
MQVRAVAEKGLLINEVATYSDTNWDEEATANQTANDSAVLLYPASTADGATWYHAASKKSNDEAGATSGVKSANLIGNYEDLATRNNNGGLVNITAMTSTATAGTAAAKETKGDAANSEAGYYVHYTYYLKSAGAAITLGQNAGDMNVKITGVTATTTANPLNNNTTPANSAALDPAIRVGIKLNSAFYIYAPVSGYTDTYYVAAGTTATEPKASNAVTNTDLATLPSTGTNGTPVDVYVWYEGEDVACMSDNATAVTLDNIKIDIAFALEQIPQP